MMVTMSLVMLFDFGDGSCTSTKREIEWKMQFSFELFFCVWEMYAQKVALTFVCLSPEKKDFPVIFFNFLQIFLGEVPIPLPLPLCFFFLPLHRIEDESSPPRTNILCWLKSIFKVVHTYVTDYLRFISESILCELLEFLVGRLGRAGLCYEILECISSE